MFPVQITLRDEMTATASANLEKTFHIKAEKLSRYCKKILRCRIMAGIEQKHRRQGDPYTVNIILSVPGRLLTVHEKDSNPAIAIRNAFDAARKQLLHYTEKRLHHNLLQHHRHRLANKKVLQSAA